MTKHDDDPFTQGVEQWRLKVEVLITELENRSSITLDQDDADAMWRASQVLETMQRREYNAKLLIATQREKIQELLSKIAMAEHQLKALLYKVNGDLSR